MNKIYERQFNKVLLEAIEEELRDELLQEGFMDFLSKINPFSGDEKDSEESSFFDGHLVLDAVALVSSFVPGAGSVISFGADVINAIWYYNTGHTFIAALYFLMAIPGVGDVLALPVQGLLKFGSKGLSKLIPFIPQIYKSRNLIKSFLTKTIVIEEKLGAKGASKAISSVMDDFFKIYEKEGAEKAGEYLAKNLDKDLVKVGGKAEEKVSDAALSKFVKSAEKQAGSLAGKAAYRGEQKIIQRAILLGSKMFADEDSSATPDEGGGGKGGKGGKGGICHGGKTPKECTNLSWGCGGPSGPTSEKVKEVQQKLIDCGFPLPKFGVDGLYCTETTGAMKKFQSSVGLTADGVAGQKSIEALNKCNSKQPEEPTPKPEPTPTPPPKPEEEKIEKFGGDMNESLRRRRYEQVEKLVFERLVKGCK